MSNTQKARTQIIQRLVARYKDVQNLRKSVEKLFGNDPNAPAWETLGWLITDLASMTSVVIGDHSDWVSWFVFENDCGKKGLRAKVNGKQFSVRSVRDLVKVIEAEDKCASQS